MKTVIKDKKRAPSRKKKIKSEPKLYEGMFLVDSGEAATDWEGVTAAVKNILEKGGAEIVSINKWDERRLAYEIGGRNKGTYILCYFKAEGGKLRSIERDIQLSERIMRALILCAEQRQVKEIEAGPQKGTISSRADNRDKGIVETASADAESEQVEEAESEDEDSADSDEEMGDNG